MRIFPMALLLAVLAAGCSAKYARPDIDMNPGDKALIGSVSVEGGTENAAQKYPDFLMLSIAPVKLAPLGNGKMIVTGIGAPQRYDIKSAWENASSLPDRLPFFIPLQPGLYALTAMSFEYGTRPIKHYEVSFGKNGGLPLVIARDADAISLGHLTVTVKNADLKTHHAETTLRVESDPVVRALFLTNHPGLAVSESLPQIRSPSSTTPSPTTK